jgi:hypothetical protein
MIKRLVLTAAAIGGAILTVVFPVDCAWAEKRIALVVGNSNYANVPKLPNPSRDAISIGQMFRDAGFDGVDLLVNASNIEFKRAIRKFKIDSDQADIAVIFYAGHGLEIGGTNYLIPVDAKLATDHDADDEAIPLERLVASADGAKHLRLIILDACRDNPFTSLMRRDRLASNRVVSAGLGKAEPTSTDTLIAYAAKAGSTAEDGDGQHSPLTTALLKNLTVPGLDVRLAFGRVRDEVMRSTGSRQEPFVYGSLGGGNISLVPAPKSQEAPLADVKADYERVAKIGTLRAWEVFLDTHKTGFYADLARVQVAALSGQQQAQTGTPITKSPGNSYTVVAGAPSAPQPGGRESSSSEALDWNKIKDSSDPSAFEKFIRKYPDAPLAIGAQKRLEILKQAAEDARLQGEQMQAAALAARKREDDERRAKAAEAEQKAKAAEAERKPVEAKQRAEEDQRTKAAAEAAPARAESYRQAAQAAAERKRAEQAGIDQALPDFPWPPPAPTTSYVLPDDLLRDRQTLGEATDAVISALERTGYVERTFFKTGPGGIALVTRLERIELDGSSARPDRWSLSNKNDSVRDIAKFLRGLFFVEEGHYRLIVFILQKQAFISSTKEIVETEARGLIGRGANVLPPAASNESYNGSHCTVMVYEFTSEGKAAHFVRESPLTAKEHLNKAGVLVLLGKGN